ncbi:Electron transfer flavoprotein, beta subunit (plasmid) [Cupriavidus necator H850]|uniref:electron transfer flavoprotein subunit beta/FixA family protein n=1 Tax=Cupriavidus necator TaxID=106590 RepID=UPI00129EFD32|nr:electron transfer flavoprotein subunit beta/FixA family protein [Cupriavidus necator]KAI3602686.1 Electron transfer flavoprotein, beta subunit [Cupriavidus necator H850]
MHILVPVKRVVDHNVNVRVRRDGDGVDTTGVKMSINPFDEVALEQAVRLKEQGLASRVTAVTCGTAVAQDVLRTALAMGADNAVLIELDDARQHPDPLGVARLLRTLMQRESVDLVLCGKQAIDDDLGAMGPMLAALLDWPQAVSVSQLHLQAGQLEVACDADGGTHRLRLPLPAIVSTELRLCDARHITLPAMMRAKKATIATIKATHLGGCAAPLVRQLSVTEPPARAPGLRADSLPALIERLRSMPALQRA